MKYVVIGGAGAMGRIVVRDLFEFAEKGDEIVVADFDLPRAKVVAAAFGDGRVRAAHTDVCDIPATVRLLRGAVVAINCIQYHLNLQVMEAALQARSHYIDLGGLFHMTRKQLPLDAKFRATQRLAILGMGAAPGITNILARVGADQLDSVREIHCRVAGVDQTRYENQPALPLSYSLQTIMEEFSLEPAVYTKGKLAFVPPMSGQVPMRFPRPVGIQKPMYTIHSEVATLPSSFREKGVQDVSFKIAFDAGFLEKVKFLRDLGLASHDPISVAGGKISPIEVVNKVAMAQRPAKQVGKLTQHEIVRAIVKGTKRKQKVTLILDCHTTGNAKWGVGSDINTGSPPAIVARMIASGEIKGSGVLPPERIVPPAPFFNHLRKRGFWLKTEKKIGWAFET